MRAVPDGVYSSRKGARCAGGNPPTEDSRLRVIKALKKQPGSVYKKVPATFLR